MRPIRWILRSGGWGGLLALWLGCICGMPLRAGIPHRLPFVINSLGMVVIEVPFEFENGHVVQLKTLLDTGSSECWLDASVITAKGASQTTIRPTRILDATGRWTKRQMPVVKGQWILPTGPTRSLQINTSDMKHDFLPDVVPFDALLGMDALSSGKLGIDFERHEVVFDDDDVYPVELPFTWKDGTIYVGLTVKNSDGSPEPDERGKWLVDTGQSDAIVLPESYGPKFQGQVYWSAGVISTLGARTHCKLFPRGEVWLGGAWRGPFDMRVGGTSVEPAIGTGLFNRCKIQIDFEHRIFRIKRYAGGSNSPQAHGRLKPPQGP